VILKEELEKTYDALLDKKEGLSEKEW